MGVSLHEEEAVRPSNDADGLENVCPIKDKFMQQFQDDLPFLFLCVRASVEEKEAARRWAPVLGLCPVRACVSRARSVELVRLVRLGSTTR